MEAYTILPRQDTAADWTSANPTLANGEFSIELDTGKFKIGDGVTAWTSLSYFAGTAAAFDIGDAGDVVVTTPADNEVLAYDNASTDWINQTAAEAGLATSSHDHDADYDAIGAAATVQGNLDTHEADVANPHAVTAAQADALPEDAGSVAVTATHTLLAANAGKVHEAVGTFTITLPNGLDPGYQAVIENHSTGAITLSATTTLQKLTSGTGLETVASVTVDTSVVVRHKGSNVWVVTGDYT